MRLLIQKVSCVSKIGVSLDAEVGVFADAVVCGGPDISLGRFE